MTIRNTTSLLEIRLAKIEADVIEYRDNRRTSAGLNWWITENVPDLIAIIRKQRKTLEALQWSEERNCAEGIVTETNADVDRICRGEPQS